MLVRRLASEHVSVSARLLDVGDGSSTSATAPRGSLSLRHHLPP
jgi:hypothetical protein